MYGWFAKALGKILGNSGSTLGKTAGTTAGKAAGAASTTSSSLGKLSDTSSSLEKLSDALTTGSTAKPAGSGVDAGIGEGKASPAPSNQEDSGTGSGLKNIMGGNPESEAIGDSAMQSAQETAENVPILDKFRDYSDRYTKGKESNLFQFARDTKEGNYAGSMGYASKLAEGAQSGAQPIPLIQLPQTQRRQPDNRYGQMYRRYRG